MTEEQEWEAVRTALRDAGVDPTDLGRFVNTPHPDIPGLGLSAFDSRRAYPVLLGWLPHVHSGSVVDTLANRIRDSGKRSESARALIAKYREQPSWQLGDAVARTMTPDEYEDVVALCADSSAGSERQIGNAETRRLIEPLADDADVGGAARDTLRRIERTRR